MKELAIEQDKKRNEEKSDPIKPEVVVVEDEPVFKPTRMSIILPALQNHGFSDDSDNESLKDPNEKHQDRPQSTADLVAEIEALEVASVPPPTAVVVPTPISTPKSLTTEKPLTYEPIPIERPYKPSSPVVENTPVIAQPEPPVVEQERQATIEDVQKEIQLTAAAVALASSSPATPNHAVEIHTDQATEYKEGTQEEEELKDAKDSGISVSRDATVRSSNETTVPEEEEEKVNVMNHLAAILPAVEESVRHVKKVEDSLPAPSRDQHILPEDRERAKHSREFEYSIEDPIDLDMFRDNVIAIQAIDPKDIPVNNLKPREQEAAGKDYFVNVLFVVVVVFIFQFLDEPVRDGMKYLFDNKFMKAKAVFQTKASM